MGRNCGANALALIMQMRSVSLELEILGRHQHPELTIPFLKVILSLVCIVTGKAEGNQRVLIA